MNKFLKYNLGLLTIIKLILFVQSEHAYNEVIFSPKQQERYSRRIVYYKPKNDRPETSTQVPWEDVLKETVILTLNNSENSSERSKSYSVKKRQNQILKATYNGLYDPNIPKFGDIVLLGKGTLQKTDNDTYSFIQSSHNCNKFCFEDQQERPNVTAVWTVERIRHRDPDRGHRYELKFTVVPLNENKTNGADTGLRISKSYIVRDEDYPKYFSQETTSSTTQNINQARSMSILLPRRSSTQRIDASTRRTVFDMFDFSPITNAFTNPFSNKIRPEFNMFDNFIAKPSQIRMPPPNGYPIVRRPVNKVRFPDQRTPFSGHQSSGVHIFLNGNHPLKPSQVTQSDKTSVYDLDKVYDYNKMMEYQGSINAKKVFPDLVKETTEVTDNTLDYRNPPSQHLNKAPNGGQSKTGEGAFQYTTVFGPSVTQTQVPQIGPQVTTGLLYPMHSIPFTTVPHIPLAPWIFPFGPHIPPQAPFSLAHHQQQTPQANLIPHPNANHLSTSALSNVQHHIPPFQPLHHSMTKIRPLPRIPTNPPLKKEVNVHIFKESPKEPQTYSAPDPFFPQTSTNHPSTSTYKSVLPSPYSTVSLESTTGATIFTDKQQHFTHTPVHLTDDDEFQPIKPVVETTFAPTPPVFHASSFSTPKPDFINSQIPLPDRDENRKTPSSDSKSQLKKTKNRIYGTGVNNLGRVKPFRPSTLYSTTTVTSVGTVGSSKYRNSYKPTEKPILKWIPKKSRKPLVDEIPSLSSSTITTTTVKTTTNKQEPAKPTNLSFIVESTTLRPKTVQATTQFTKTTIAKSTVSTTIKPIPRFRGRGRYSLKRRGDNKTDYGSLEDRITSQESKTSISTSVSIETNNRRRLQRKRVSRFNNTLLTTTTESPKRGQTVFYVTSTPTLAPFLPTTSVEPSTTITSEIIRANVHPLDTKIDELHLFKATDAHDQSEVPSNINELDNLAVSILEHARSLHSEQNYNQNRKENKKTINNYHRNSNNDDNNKLPLETFFRQ